MVAHPREVLIHREVEAVHQCLIAEFVLLGHYGVIPHQHHLYRRSLWGHCNPLGKALAQLQLPLQVPSILQSLYRMLSIHDTVAELEIWSRTPGIDSRIGKQSAKQHIGHAFPLIQLGVTLAN